MANDHYHFYIPLWGGRNSSVHIEGEHEPMPWKGNKYSWGKFTVDRVFVPNMEMHLVRSITVASLRYSLLESMKDNEQLMKYNKMQALNVRHHPGAFSSPQIELAQREKNISSYHYDLWLRNAFLLQLNDLPDDFVLWDEKTGVAPTPALVGEDAIYA